MPAIGVRDAVKRAQAFLADLFPDRADIRLEEIELDDNGRFWNVTLSFPGRDVSLFGGVLPTQREYKTVEIDAETGEAHAVKIRVLNA